MRVWVLAQVVAGAGAGAGAGLHYARIRRGITGEGREVAPRVGGITGKGAEWHRGLATLLEREQACITQRTKTHTLDRCTGLWTHARLWKHLSL